MSMIKCKDLSLGYEGKVIISNLNFSVNHGDYLCIVGENGSGKSTLMKTLLRLIKPLSGTVDLDFDHSSVGYLPQQTEIQKDFPASVKEVVLSGCSAAKKSLFFDKSAKDLVEYNLKKLGIYDISKEYFKELSGGQQQRVFLARALCAAKGILFLDEPVSGLDPVVTSELYSILFELNKKDKMTIVMISHDISAALKHATHILHIGQNESVFGTVDEYLKSSIGKHFVVGGN